MPFPIQDNLLLFVIDVVPFLSLRSLMTSQKFASKQEHLHNISDLHYFDKMTRLGYRNRDKWFLYLGVLIQAILKGSYGYQATKMY